jgi:FMN phosphatase YigB (HAD superfamily)
MAEDVEKRSIHMAREDILYVGDNVDDDIRGARAVGLPAILIDRHDRWPEADCVRIRSLSELAEVAGDWRSPS